MEPRLDPKTETFDAFDFCQRGRKSAYLREITMRHIHRLTIIGLLCGCGMFSHTAAAQWNTIYGSAREQARQLSSASLAVPLSPDQWEATASQRREMWREMIGLSPLPPRTPLAATITGVLERGDYVVEKIHFQSVPGAYVAG